MKKTIAVLLAVMGFAVMGFAGMAYAEEMKFCIVTPHGSVQGCWQTLTSCQFNLANKGDSCVSMPSHSEKKQGLKNGIPKDQKYER